jgi:hypothetical protein
MKDPLKISQKELEGIYTSFCSDSLPATAERRTEVRWPFSKIQLLGPYGSWGLPKKHMFFEIHCHDLAQTGISFFLSRPPVFELAVIGLGKQPNVNYFLVRVVHCREYADDPKKKYLVGCCFLQRVSIEDSHERI